MTMTIPTIPSLPAGYVVQAADLENLAYACEFLLYKPICRVHQATSGQSLSTSGTIITWDTRDFDPDGMYSSSATDRLTIQTPGYYRVRYMVATNGVSANGWCQVNRGPNNPAGSGFNNYWPCYNNANTYSMMGAAGDIPVYMYIDDYVRIQADPNTTGYATSTAFEPSYLSLELISV